MTGAMDGNDTFASGVLSFYKSIAIDAPLPQGVTYMNPYRDPETMTVTETFYHKYYNDNTVRRIILGINPGRFGGGITGIPFTDPINLELYCGIPNAFQKKPELSSTFIYRMIDLFGGPAKFYQRYFVSALSPLGFISNGKNLNYYDIPALQRTTEPFIISCIEKQLLLPIDRTMAFCLGEGENYRYLSKLNAQYGFFENIVALPHPRFIMQYKRKMLKEYLGRYVECLSV